MSLMGAVIMGAWIPLVNNWRRGFHELSRKPNPIFATRPRTMAPLSARNSTRVVVARRSGRESARVYESLRRQILDGDLAAGVHLSQQAIALAEGTSNGPVISALRRLA